MSMTISLRPVMTLDADGINSWIEKAVQPLFPGKDVSVMPRPGIDATGESRFFCPLDIDQPIPLSELKNRVITEHSRGMFIYFYADDLLNAGGLSTCFGPTPSSSTPS